MKKKMVSSLLVVIFIVVLLITGISQINRQRDQNAIKEFTAYFDVPGNEIEDNNAIQNEIARITGVKCKEIWLVGQNADEAVAHFIAGEEYPDFISGSRELYEADALIPIDEYWEDYPNIRNYLKDYEWDKFRQEDGHIYWIPQFGVVSEEGAMDEPIHNGEAFWIQTRVLKWAGYPEISTVEEYFALIESYMEANPEMENGTNNIPFTILCDDWRYFCLENPPQFLAGYPNDGCCIVDPETLKVIDYNMIPEAREYFKILNQEYQKGYIDPESFTQSYSEYLKKLSSGAVLGMVDQWWQFAYDINYILERPELNGKGYNYVPLPITLEEGVTNQWHVGRRKELDVSKGIAVTVSCTDISGALKFINDLLEEDVQNLRFWGIEGEDYQIDKEGYFYRTQEQRYRVADSNLQASHFCIYSYFPRIEGLNQDGKNAFSPEWQPQEFSAGLPIDVKECLAAYECENYVDMLGNNKQLGPWYPMYTYSTMLTADTEAGIVWNNMGEVKHEYLPQVIMAENFEEMWKIYMEKYNACAPEKFFEEIQQELEARVEKAKSEAGEE